MAKLAWRVTGETETSHNPRDFEAGLADWLVGRGLGSFEIKVDWAEIGVGEVVEAARAVANGLGLPEAEIRLPEGQVKVAYSINGCASWSLEAERELKSKIERKVGGGWAVQYGERKGRWYELVRVWG